VWKLFSSAAICSAIALALLVPSTGGGATPSSTDSQSVAEASSATPGAITCITGINLVEFIFTGHTVQRACADLRYHMIHTFGRSAPSLESGAFANENRFAQRQGGSVTVVETGSDNSDINALAAGVLLGDGYRVHFGRWTSFQVP
jgi:hypothetical protein